MTDHATQLAELAVARKAAMTKRADPVSDLIRPALDGIGSKTGLGSAGAGALAGAGVGALGLGLTDYLTRKSPRSAASSALLGGALGAVGGAGLGHIAGHGGVGGVLNEMSNNDEMVIANGKGGPLTRKNLLHELNGVPAADLSTRASEAASKYGTSAGILGTGAILGGKKGALLGVIGAIKAWSDAAQDAKR